MLTFVLHKMYSIYPHTKHFRDTSSTTWLENKIVMTLQLSVQLICGWTASELQKVQFVRSLPRMAVYES